MRWSLQYAASAARSIRKLDPQIRRRVRRALRELSADPERGKPLQLTLKGLRSWRTGDFRIIYRIVHDRLEVLVIALGHRRDVYDRVRQLIEGTRR